MEIGGAWNSEGDFLTYLLFLGGYCSPFMIKYACLLRVNHMQMAIAKILETI